MSQAASVNDLEAYVNSAFGDEDDDESADEEADENLETKRCLRTFQAFRNAVFPQIFPVFWLIIPFITCAILSFYIFVDPMLRGKHIQMWRSSASGAYSAIDSNPNATLVRELTVAEYMLCVIKLFCAASGVHIVLYLAFMMARRLLIFFMFNKFTHESRGLPFLEPLDPEVTYVLWSICSYGLFKLTLQKSNLYISTNGNSEQVRAVFISKLLPTFLFVDEAGADLYSGILVSTIVLAVRHLVASILIFAFGLSFMTNMNPVLLSYLTKYSLLRRLNASWIAFHESRVNSKIRLGERNQKSATLSNEDDTKSIMAVNTLTSQVSDRYSNPSSKISFHNAKDGDSDIEVEGVDALLEEAEAAKRLSESVELPLKGTSDLWLRFQRRVSHNRPPRALKNKARIPVQLSQESIERSQTSKLQNWALIQYSVLHFPAFFVDSHWVELASKTIAGRIAEQLFLRLLKDARTDNMCNCSLIPFSPIKHTHQSPFLHPQTSESAPGTSNLEATALKGSGSENKIAEPIVDKESWPMPQGSTHYTVEADDKVCRHFIPGRNLNSSLLANMNPKELWWGEGNISQTPKNDVRERRLLPCEHKPAQFPYGQTFGREFLSQFLNSIDVEMFMKEVDFAGHGKVDQTMFRRYFCTMYSQRSELIRSLKNQASIMNTVTQMISLLLWTATAVCLLLAFGVDLNTVVVAGAATISALIVLLSYLYQNFITAVIFIAFTHPYSIGDRVVIDDGIPMYVTRIKTYTTEFENIYGVQIVFSNSVLFDKKIMNLSRSKHATVALKMLVASDTNPQQLQLIENGINSAIYARPMDYVKDSFSIFVTDYQPGRYIEGFVFEARSMGIRSGKLVKLSKNISPYYRTVPHGSKSPAAVPDFLPQPSDPSQLVPRK